MKSREKSPAEESSDAIWQRRATANAIIAMRKLFQEGDIPPGTPVSRLSDVELGWLHASSLFAWIRNRSEQAAANGWNTEEALRRTGLDCEPWDSGSVAHILPELGSLPDLDWSKPIGAWPKDDVIYLVLQALKLTRAAMIARDVGGGVSDPGSLEDAATEPSVPDGSASSPTPGTHASEALRAPGNGEFHDEPIPF